MTRVYLSAPLLLSETLLGGQSFRWRPLPSGEFVGIVRGHVWTLKALDESKGVVEWRSHPPEPTERLLEYLGEKEYRDLLEILRQDPSLSILVERHVGLRVLRIDPWEALGSFVVSANNNVPRIEKTLDRLSRLLGERIEGEDFSFPDPTSVALASVRILRKAGLGYRAPLLQGAARQWIEEESLVEDLSQMPLKEARRRLMEFPGVGPKVAECVLLFGVGRTEAFPVDRWVQRISVRSIFRRSLSVPQLQDEAQRRWGKAAGLAQQILFHESRLRGNGRRAPGVLRFPQRPLEDREAHIPSPITHQGSVRRSRSSWADSER